MIGRYKGIKVYPPGFGFPAEYDVSYGYDSYGRFKKVINGSDVYKYKYLANSNLVSKIKYPHKIKALFKDVSITYEIGEPEAVEVDGVLTIIQNETSVVNITDEQIKAITEGVENVRNSIVK